MIRKPLRLRKFKPPLSLSADRLNCLQFFQHLDAGLRLARLRCLIAEAVNKSLQVRRGPFIRAGTGFLLTEPLNPHRFEVGIVAGVAADRSVLN